MRKFMFGLLVALFSVFLAANPASAESEVVMDDDKMSEQEASSSPVDCVFNDYQAAYAKAGQPYMVDDLIRFEITLSDPDSAVSNIRFNASINQKGWTIQEDTTTVAYWTAPSAGEWLISVQLFDSSGQEIIPTGDCDGNVTVLQMTDPAHPDHPDEVEMPEEPVEPEQPPSEEGPCANADPSTLVPVPEDDGSTSYYTPEGAFCGTVLGTAPTAPEPVLNNDPTTSVAAQQSAAPQAAELARTGAGLTITAIVGFALVLTGFFALYVRRFAPNTLPAKG